MLTLQYTLHIMTGDENTVSKILTTSRKMEIAERRASWSYVPIICN